MEVNLPADLDQFVNAQVTSGVVSSANDAICHAVEVWRQQEGDRVRREEILREVDIGIAQLDRGEGIVVPLERLDEFFEDIKQEGRRRLELRPGN